MEFCLHTIAQRLSALVIYGKAAGEEPLASFSALIRAAEEEKPAAQLTAAYAAFLTALYQKGGDFGQALSDLLLTDDNFYVRRTAAGKPVSAEMQACFTEELAFFTALTRLTCTDLAALIGLDTTLPRYATTPAPLDELIPARLAEAGRYGYGEYARHAMFRVDDSGHIRPVRSPDPVRLSDLVGYEEERGEVIRNTRALLCGRPAANALLCGDAGTGKSATVKAVVNEFFSDGLRLIELHKDQLPLLAEIMGELAENPLKFILFIDDLSFACDDDGYAALKAVLEGSATARVPNAVIYATSNRRHLVRETFSSREGDEVHRRDTMEELLSLSARFGLTVLFSRPSKPLYLAIVHTLAEGKGIDLPEEELDRMAEAFALAKGGRSARAAGQFIDHLLTDRA